jgi:hypothetical protein
MVDIVMIRIEKVSVTDDHINYRILFLSGLGGWVPPEYVKDGPSVMVP